MERVPPEQRGQRPLNRTQHHYVLRTLDDTAELFENTETTVLDEEHGAPITTQQQALHQAACGHVVVDVARITGCSLCGKYVCGACQVRCGRCLRILCNEHARWLAGSLFCPRCRVIVFMQQAALLSAVAIARLLRSVAGLIPAFLRGAHRLLSKEL